MVVRKTEEDERVISGALLIGILGAVAAGTGGAIAGGIIGAMIAEAINEEKKRKR